MYMTCKAKGNVAAKQCAMPKGVSPSPIQPPCPWPYGQVANSIDFKKDQRFLE